MGEKQKRPNKGPFFVTHRIERVKRGGGKGHIYFRGCGSSILRTYYDVLPTKSVTYYSTFSPHKSDKQSHQYKVDYNIKCSVVLTYSWQILNNDKSLYLKLGTLDPKCFYVIGSWNCVTLFLILNATIFLLQKVIITFLQKPTLKNGLLQSLILIGL